MDQPVYSASPLWIFTGTFVGIAFMLVLGAGGLIFAFFNRKEKKITRIFMGLLGLFLCTMGALGLGFTALSMLSGAKTATVSLVQKNVVEANCGDNGSTCTRYVLETTAGTRSYDFTVEQKAFDATQEGGCYKVTYYPNQGLFAGDENTDLYVAIEHVTGIRQLEPGACQ
jgi:hypothetical protein